MIAMRSFWCSISRNWIATSVAREEWMVSQTLFTGKIVCLDGDTSEIVAEVDYTPISQSVVNPLWSAASTCDPLKDLKTAMRLVSGACGFSADLIVHGQGCQRCLRER